MLASRPDSGKPTPPAMSTFTPEVELLTFIGEALQAIQGTLVQMRGGKPHHIKPLPRPVTAMDRAREAARSSRLTSLVTEAESAMQRYADTTGG